MKSENSRRGKRSRVAGHSYERQIVKELKELGFKNAVSSRSESKNLDDKGVDVANTPGYSVQCKNSKTNPNYVELLNDLNTIVSLRGTVKVILHKKTKKAKANFIPVGEYALLTKQDFYNLLKLAEQGKFMEIFRDKKHEKDVSKVL